MLVWTRYAPKHASVQSGKIQSGHMILQLQEHTGILTGEGFCSRGDSMPSTGRFWFLLPSISKWVLSCRGKTDSQNVWVWASIIYLIIAGLKTLDSVKWHMFSQTGMYLKQVSICLLRIFGRMNILQKHGNDSRLLFNSVPIVFTYSVDELFFPLHFSLFSQKYLLQSHYVFISSNNTPK